ncbi:MAG: hypothetical protein LBM95_01580 [Lactobacillales bacterium]|jgi:uncharacterized membrane protein|nr:hypothetical protein [Lactobacillales bacterium]
MSKKNLIVLGLAVLILLGVAGGMVYTKVSSVQQLLKIEKLQKELVQLEENPALPEKNQEAIKKVLSDSRKLAKSDGKKGQDKIYQELEKAQKQAKNALKEQVGKAHSSLQKLINQSEQVLKTYESYQEYTQGLMQEISTAKTVLKRNQFSEMNEELETLEKAYQQFSNNTFTIVDGSQWQKERTSMNYWFNFRISSAKREEATKQIVVTMEQYLLPVEEQTVEETGNIALNVNAKDFTFFDEKRKELSILSFEKTPQGAIFPGQTATFQVILQDLEGPSKELQVTLMISGVKYYLVSIKE